MQHQSTCGLLGVVIMQLSDTDAETIGYKELLSVISVCTHPAAAQSFRNKEDVKYI